MSSVVRESVRLVRKQIFSFFPRETFTCLRCVIKRSALSRPPPPLLAHYPMRAAYIQGDPYGRGKDYVDIKFKVPSQAWVAGQPYS